jgi:carbohydrate-selective porin OprB
MSGVLGNVTGGIHRGADYDGMTEMSLGIGTGKAIGWAGGTFNVSALQIHGRSLSTDNLAILQTASGIEADRASRLSELWYQQTTPDGRADLKLGQQAIDLEFMTSQGASIFFNSAMGWPELPSQDLFGIGFGVAQVSRNAAALDGDVAFFSGVPTSARGTETFIEITYQYQVIPWWQLQPDLQYVFAPGGGLQNQLGPPRRIGNEAVLGSRTAITFSQPADPLRSLKVAVSRAGMAPRPPTAPAWSRPP